MNQYIGKRLGVYQLLEQIGQGGMATIFKAYQASMDRYVAVKILPSHFTEDETFVARFTQEARTLARLEHPHILPVHDYGEQEGITYLVMRYVEAGTLKDLIAQKGPIELREAARILSQIGRALDYAHSQGVVHRDIKPTNVLIDRRGDAFLTDFGIAKLVAGTAQFTATGALVGTPAYMSPEQGMGESVDHRSDIYSLGVVLYELVTGRVPFEAETPLAVLLKHVNAPLSPPRQIKPDLPEAVERVILKAMAKAPDDRFQTARGMIDALQSAVASVAKSALPQPLAETVQAAIPAPTEAAAPRRATPSAAPHQRAAPAAAPALRSLPWLPIAGAAALVVVLLIAALLVLPNLGGGESKETPVSETPARPTATQAVVQVATEPSPTVEPSPTPIPPTATPTQVPTTPARVSYSPGWTNYSNGNVVFTLARQDGYLWAGGEGGLVRWDVNDGSYVKFGVPDGLASSRVNDLLVDADGGLWIATDAGINYFSDPSGILNAGENWFTFDMDDGLDTEWVQTLFLDDDGGLWAGTSYGERGLNYYYGAEWGAPPIPPLPVEFANPHVFLIDDEGGLLVGLEQQGLAYYDGVEWALLTSADGLPNDQVVDMLLTDDALWVSFVYEVVRFDLETGDWEAVTQLQYIGITAMHQASDGSLWFVGEGGAHRYDPALDVWQQFPSGRDVIPSWAVTDIIEDDNGLWMSTFDGVVFFDGSSWETWTTDDNLGGNDVQAIVPDNDGMLWFVHPDRGMSRFDPASETWQTFSEDEGALNWPSIPGIDSNGHVWIGGYGELRKYDGRDWQTLTPPELIDAGIDGIFFGPNDVQWLVTDIGLMRHDLMTNEWTLFGGVDHPALEEVWAFLVASDGTIWVGGEEALIYYDGFRWDTPAAAGDQPVGFIDELAEAPDGSVWVVANGELFHLVGKRWDRFGWPGESWVENVAVGPDGTVWVGGYDGLGRFEPSRGAWQTFTTDDGLIHPYVQALHVTTEGVVWIGTEGGVSRYVPEQ